VPERVTSVTSTIPLAVATSKVCRPARAATTSKVCTPPWPVSTTCHPQRTGCLILSSSSTSMPCFLALEAIAGVDEVSVNEEIRRAIAAHIEARRRDTDFRKRLDASIARHKDILERLAR